MSLLALSRALGGAISEAKNLWLLGLVCCWLLCSELGGAVFVYDFSGFWH